MSEQAKGILLLVGLTLGWLILLVIVPPLAVFLLFLPMITANDRERLQRMKEERERGQGCQEEQRQDRTTSLTMKAGGEGRLESKARDELRAVRESVLRDLRTSRAKDSPFV